MNPNQATPPAEPAVVTPTEPVATPQAPATPVTAPAATPTVVEDPAELRKQLQQIEMERNMLRNKNKEFTDAAETARQAELSETQRLQEQLNTLQAERDQLEARQMRENFINEYPDEATRQIARNLLAKNESAIAWGDVADVEAAKAEVFSQLDALKGPTAPVTNPTVHANNPAPTGEVPADRDALIAEAAKTGDWSKVYATIPSVNESIQYIRGE